MTDSSAVQRRLDLLLASRPADGLFQVLERLATGDLLSLPIPIGLIVDGRLVRGQIARPTETASHLDRMLQQVLSTATIHVNNAEGNSEEETNFDEWRAALRQALDGTFLHAAQSIVDRMKDAEGLLDPESNFNMDTASDSDFEKALPALLPIGIVDLADAELQLSDGSWQRVGSMRVRRESISAWWPNLG